jgi:hypothetical protein
LLGCTGLIDHLSPRISVPLAEILTRKCGDVKR